MKQINDKGLQIIKDSEGLKLKPYLCPAGLPTIGYGTRIPSLDYPEIDEETAEILLMAHVDTVQQQLAQTLGLIKVNTNQWSSLVSFVYNIGIGQFKKSTMLRRLQDRNYEAAADEFPKWNKSKGRILPGLVARREKERALFLETVQDA